MMNSEELKAVIEKHGLWLNDEEGGERAYLRGANLGGAYLRGANLGDANLRGANLGDANLGGANLGGANLGGAYLRGANLGGANLRGANLGDANLRGANLGDANLGGANLGGANLSGAYLRSAYLGGAIGNLSELKSVFLETWPITYTSEVMQIGCERHLICDWWAFDDDRISRMDSQALEWWRKWKPVLQQIVEMSPATPTGHENTSEEAA